ncbi:hypothetical protein [Streptomyces sp. ET3-23]|nr:hypothetical protein [Streptomyces sp. ET3-23]
MGKHDRKDDGGKPDMLPGQPWNPPKEKPQSDGGMPKGDGKRGK